LVVGDLVGAAGVGAGVRTGGGLATLLVAGGAPLEFDRSIGTRRSGLTHSALGVD